MRFVTILSSFLSSFLVQVAPAQTADTWDLRRCVEYAMSHNISVRQAEVQASISEIALKQSKLQQIPSLNFQGSHGFSFGRNVDPTTNIITDRSSMFQQLALSSQVNIFNWNSQRNTIASNDLIFQADKAALEKAKNDIGLLVANQYLVTLLRIEAVSVNEVALAQTRSQLSNTRKLVEAGTVPELNAVELEAQFARDSATQLTSQNEVELNLLTLKAYLNLPADTPFQIAAPPVENIPIDNIMELTPAAVYEMAIKTQPQIKMNNLLLQASQKNYQAFRGRLYPTISAFGQISTNYFAPFNRTSLVDLGFQPTDAYAVDGAVQYPVFARNFGASVAKNSFGQLWEGYWRSLKDQFGQNVGIGINVPIFNGWSAKANAERARWDIKSRELIVEQETLKLKQDVYSAYNQAMGAFQTFLARQKAEEFAQRSFDLATKRYNIGVMQTIEWLIIQNNLSRAKIDKLIAQFDYVFKMKVLEFYKGLGVRL
jgi:outer membrane protein